MDLQKRTQEATLSGLLNNMSPTAIFNRFDLSASNGQHFWQYQQSEQSHFNSTH
jgi:hypothetical protein